MPTPDHNLSTDHQPKGAAASPSDTLDRIDEDVADGQRSLNADSARDPDEANDTARAAG